MKNIHKYSSHAFLFVKIHVNIKNQQNKEWTQCYGLESGLKKDEISLYYVIYVYVSKKNLHDTQDALQLESNQRINLFYSNNIYIYIYIYICEYVYEFTIIYIYIYVCVCVCVCERERERERERENGCYEQPILVRPITEKAHVLSKSNQTLC